jgi:hypothetical protein
MLIRHSLAPAGVSRSMQSHGEAFGQISIPMWFTLTFNLQVSKNTARQEGSAGTAVLGELGPEPSGDDSEVGSAVGASARRGGSQVAENHLFTTLSGIADGQLMCVHILKNRCVSFSIRRSSATPKPAYAW